MPKDLPSDSAIRAYLHAQVRDAKDVSSLSRRSLKDSVQEHFSLDAEQRALFDEDAHYKKAIKAWIQEALEAQSDEQEEHKVESTGKPSTSKSGEKRKKGSAQAKEVEDVEEMEEEAGGGGGMSEFSSLEDDEPKITTKKARKSSDSAHVKASGRTSSSKQPDGLEARLKKLKNYVLLCGTRKPWNKLFDEQGCGGGDLSSYDEERQKKMRRGQVAVVEDVLRQLGMTTPYSRAKAEEIKMKKELEQDIEEIQIANRTEKRATRGNRGKQASSPTPPETSLPTEGASETLGSKKFNRSLADFAAELNDDD